MHHARSTDVCKFPLETCQIHYGKSVGCESNVFFHDFFSFAAAASLVSEASKLSEKSFYYNPKPFSKHKMTDVLNTGGPDVEYD